MNFKKFISGVSAFAIAASAFAGLAVTANAADYTNGADVGASDYSTGAFEATSNVITLANGQTAKFKFTNYSNAGTAWNNWIAGVSTTAVTEYTEANCLVAMRADYWDQKTGDARTGLTTTISDWAAFPSFINGADVEVTFTNNNGYIKIHADMTKDNSTLTDTYYGQPTGYTAGDSVKVFMTVFGGCYLTDFKYAQESVTGSAITVKYVNSSGATLKSDDTFTAVTGDYFDLASAYSAAKKTQYTQAILLDKDSNGMYEVYPYSSATQTSFTPTEDTTVTVTYSKEDRQYYYYENFEGDNTNYSAYAQVSGRVQSTGSTSKYYLFHQGTGSGTRTGNITFKNVKTIPANTDYQLDMDISIDATYNDSKGSNTQISIMNTSFRDSTNQTEITSEYLTAFTVTKNTSEATIGNNSETISNFPNFSWTGNKAGITNVTAPNLGHLTLAVDVSESKGLLTVTNSSGTQLYKDTITITDPGNAITGIRGSLGRQRSGYAVDNIRIGLVPNTISTTNGEGITVTPDRNEAVAGETVTVTYSLDGKYKDPTIEVKDGNDDTVTTTSTDTGWTFTMPSSSVSITSSATSKYGTVPTYTVPAEALASTEYTAGSFAGINGRDEYARGYNFIGHVDFFLSEGGKVELNLGVGTNSLGDPRNNTSTYIRFDKNGFYSEVGSGNADKVTHISSLDTGKWYSLDMYLDVKTAITSSAWDKPITYTLSTGDELVKSVTIQTRNSGSGLTSMKFTPTDAYIANAVSYYVADTTADCDIALGDPTVYHGKDAAGNDTDDVATGYIATVTNYGARGSVNKIIMTVDSKPYEQDITTLTFDKGDAYVGIVLNNIDATEKANEELVHTVEASIN